MAKMACAQCGGAKKMAKGGSSKSCPPGEHLVRGVCTPKMFSSTGAKIGVGTVLAGAAGMIGSAIKKKAAANKTKKEETGTTMAKQRKMDRQDKRYMRKYEKQKAEELMKSKRFQTGGMTGIVGMPKYGNNPNTQEGRMLKNGGAFAPNRAVQASCKNGMVRDADGRCVMQRMMQMGGTTVKARKTITGGTKVKATNGEKVTVTRRNKAGDITKQSARKAVKGWSEDDYKVGGTIKKKTVKTSIKKYQTGGGKINGYNIYQGPVTKQMSNVVAKNYPAGVGPRAITPEVTEADNMKRMGENLDRIPQTAQSTSKQAGRVRKHKTGGATKATKFAALAPPYDKATAADRIAGAKKNARKK